MSCAAECGESCRLVGADEGADPANVGAGVPLPMVTHMVTTYSWHRPTYLPTYLWQRRETMSGELLFCHTIFELVG